MNLLIACTLLLQDKTAEETFKKIQETFATANTLTFKFNVKVVKAIGGGESALKGTILFKEGNRMRCDFSILLNGGSQREMLVVSDGSKVAALADGRNREEKEVSKDFNATLAAVITHGGVLSFIAGFHSLFAGEKKGALNAEKAPSVTEIKTGEDDGDMKTLSYKTVITPLAAQPATFDVRLWYEPKSLRLVKRTMSYRSETESRIFNETYEEFTLNADIPDEKFKLPTDK
jgi:outer membrane lipoprotein-sorting protein